MIRPEASDFLKRWGEVGIATAVTLAALWIVGLPNFSLNWLSVLLGAPLGVAGVVWVRVAVRRALSKTGEGQGKLFVEERRVLHVGSLANVQVNLDDATRIELFARGEVATLMVHTDDGPPVALPLGAEGADALFDALTGLPGMRMDALHARLAKARTGKGEMVTIWARPAAPNRSLGR